MSKQLFVRKLIENRYIAIGVYVDRTTHVEVQCYAGHRFFTPVDRLHKCIECKLQQKKDVVQKRVEAKRLVQLTPFVNMDEKNYCSM